MTDKQTGGPAFPIGLEAFGEDKTGMTLRDYFAAKAMAAYWSDPHVACDQKTAAAWAYEMADAMLKAREQ
jgi:hypothetical protein